MTTKPALFQLLLTLPIFFLLFAPQKAAHPQAAQNKNLVAVKHFSDKSYLEVIWSDTGDYLLIESQAEPSKSEDMITATLVSTKTKKERRLKRLEETLRRLYGDFRVKITFSPNGKFLLLNIEHGAGPVPCQYFTVIALDGGMEVTFPVNWFINAVWKWDSSGLVFEPMSTEKGDEKNFGPYRKPVEASLTSPTKYKPTKILDYLKKPIFSNLIAETDDGGVVLDRTETRYKFSLVSWKTYRKTLSASFPRSDSSDERSDVYISPNGKHLLFVRWKKVPTSDPKKSDQVYEFFLGEMANGALKKVYDTGIVKDYPTGIQWLPDNERISFIDKHTFFTLKVE